MKKLTCNKCLKNYFILFLFLIILEVMFRKLSNINLFDKSFLRIILGTSILSLVLSYFLSFLNEKHTKFLVIIIAFMLTIYSFLQLGFRNFLGVYISLNTSSQLGAVIDYIREFLKSFLPRFYLILIPFGLLILYYLFLARHFKRTDHKKFVLKEFKKSSFKMVTLTSMIFLALLSYLYYESLNVSFMQKPLQVITAKKLFNNPNVPSAVINEYGILGFGLLDVKALIIKKEEKPVTYFAESNPLQSHVVTRSVDDYYFQKVNEKETNEVYKNINNYLLNQNITDYNSYTGLFKGKNLIVIMGESVNEIFINEEYFPNFYKLYNEGISFKNNYSPRNSCSTGNNEFSGLTGLYSIYNNCTANVFKKNTYFTSLFNLFNNKGYKTSSMHDYTEAYYYRETIHPNLGSKAYYGVQKLKIPYRNEYRNWASDEDFMRVAMDITLKDLNQPFMLWLTTVSSHQPYIVPSIEGDKYYDLFKDLWSDEINKSDPNVDLKRYLSKLKILDLGLGVLLDKLTEAGILDDTVIVFYGDHYPYGLKNNKINKLLNYDLNDYEVERVPLTIYNSKTPKEIITKYTSYINLTPTLANLFDLDYDPRMYMGHDVLSDDYLNLVTFADGSWKNDIAFYDASTSTIKYYTDKNYTEEEIRGINNIVTNKMQMSATIIKNNYFKYLEDKINEEKILATPLTENDIDERSEN